MMGFDGYGAGPGMWLGGGLMMLLVVGGVILLAVWITRIAGGPSQPTSSNAIEVLKARLAAGEITSDEYEKTRRVLQG